MIFVTIASKGDERKEEEIRAAWERALSGAVARDVENVEKITVVSAPPSEKNELKPPSPVEPSKISLTIRREEEPPPKFYYGLSEGQWLEIPGELPRVWQFRFNPRDIGITEGMIKIRGDMGDRRVHCWVHVKSTGKHVLELAEQ
jgi:hypothetical protein